MEVNNDVLNSDQQFMFEDKEIKLRDYQKKAINNLLKMYDAGKNGYAWHCSASGNSISSYILAKCFESMEDVDKVILITSKRDSLFKNSNLISYPTKKFLNKLSSNKFVAVSSSIFNFAINSEDYKLRNYTDLNCVFIIDDSMVTFYSDHMSKLRRFFRNSNFYGFIAPPDFGKKSGFNRKIDYYFENKVSEYFLDDAFEDGVLSKVNLEFLGSDNLNNLNLSRDFITSQDRIEKISDWIINNHDEKTLNSKYSSVLFVPSTVSAFKYYDILKNKMDLKVCLLTKTYDEFRSMDRNEVKSKLQDTFNDFNDMFGLKRRNYSKKHKTELLNKFNDGEIDLLITTDNNLKYNNKYVNTLYWDYYHKSPRLYPFSVVDRVFNDKESNVVVFTDFNENEKELSDIKKRYKLNNYDDINRFHKISGVYHLIYDDEIIYIGQSNNLKNRLIDHWEANVNELLDSIKKDDGKFNLTKYLAMYMLIEDNLDDVEFEVIECSKSELNIVEQREIKKHSPRYNIQGVSKPFFRDVI